jgi:dTMP kinase
MARSLEKAGIRVVTTFEPGGTEIGKRIREILLDAGNNHLCPVAELMLYEADRAQHVAEVITPALEQGAWVISDRFYDATVAYQGAARSVDMDLIQLLNRTVTLKLEPDLTFLLDCPVETGLNRARTRNSEQDMEGQDRFERENLDFHRSVRSGYLDIAKSCPGRFRIIDAANAVDQIQADILAHLEPYVRKGCSST